MGGREEPQVSSYPSFQRWDTVFPPCFLGAISLCPLGIEKKFRLLLIFQRDRNPQKTAWVVFYGIAWAGPQRFGALLGTSTASSGARHRCAERVPGWAAMSPRAASCLGAARGGDHTREVPVTFSASCWAQMRSSQFWSRVKGSSALSGPCSAACQGHPSCLLAAMATRHFQPPRNATWVGLCENQVLQ